MVDQTEGEGEKQGVQCHYNRRLKEDGALQVLPQWKLQTCEMMSCDVIR